MPDVPISQQIDELCDAFEAALRGGRPMKIEECLAQITPEHRETLFRELLEIELELADSVPGQPEQTVIDRSYQSRFPQYSELIAKVLFRVVKQQRIGDYEIIREIGHGGMGVVYKARHNLLDQVVAVKVLPESLMNDPLAVARFRREMQLIGQLTHPNIVRALNAGQQDDTHYFVMEYVNGVNLQQFVSRQTGRIPLPVVCEIIRQAAMGLAQIHLFHLVHRDIKPANLMLDYSGTVKIHDLGLGKFLSEQSADNDLTLTQLGTTMGTIDYMSPEQCENAGEVDIRTDIYALGCTFYFLAAGHAPYSDSRFDSTRKKLMAHIVGEVPALAASVPDVPPALEQVFNKMMAKSPDDRFQTPQELAEALAPFADEQMLFDFLLAWREEQGIASEVMLTPRPQVRSAAQKPREREKKSWPKWLFALPVLCVALVCLMFVFSPAATETSADVEALQTDLAQLPGLNGRWWFDEIPWYIPPVREAMWKQLDTASGRKTILTDNPVRIYNPNVSSVYRWLRDFTEARALAELTPPQQALVASLMQLADPENADANFEKSLAAAIADFEAAHRDDHWTAVDMHTLANLKHAVAGKSESIADAGEAARCYEKASALYAAEAKSSQRLQSLAILCRTDGLRIEYATVARKESKTPADYDTLFEKFEEVCNARPLSPLLEVEFRAAFGALAAEAGRFAEAVKQFKLADKALENFKTGNIAAHPLKAHVAERHGWCLMDMWDVAEARKLFADAWRFRTNYYDLPRIDKSKPNYAVDYYILHDRHALAMATRYAGESEIAEKSYAGLQNEIDRAIQEFKSDPQSPVASRQILDNLYERAGNTRERRADCVFYSGAAAGIDRERFAEMAELYRQAGEFYKPPGMKRVMRLKQAIALMLIGGDALAEGETLLDGVLAEEKIEKLSGNQIRYSLIRDLAGAVLALKKEDGLPADEKRRPLEDFLRRFPSSTNAAPDPTLTRQEAARRENLELRLFAAEMLLTDLLQRGEHALAVRDVMYLDAALSDLKGDSPEMLAFKKRFIGLANRIRQSVGHAGKI